MPASLARLTMVRRMAEAEDAPGCFLASFPVAGSHLNASCWLLALSPERESKAVRALEYQLVIPSAREASGSNSLVHSGSGPAGRSALIIFGLTSLRTALWRAAPDRNRRTAECGLNSPFSYLETATTLASMDLLTTK